MNHWEHREDPRDFVDNYNSDLRSQSPRNRPIPLQNRFAPLSNYQGDRFEDNQAITRHPNQYNDYPVSQRDNYHDSPFEGQSSFFLWATTSQKGATKKERH